MLLSLYLFCSLPLQQQLQGDIVLTFDAMHVVLNFCNSVTVDYLYLEYDVK